MSSTRGVGVYTRELVTSLQKKYPRDKFVLDQAQAKGADLIHYPFFDPYFLTLKLGRGVPTIATIHDLIPIRFPRHFPVGVRGKLTWIRQKSLAKKLNHIVTDSEASKLDILNHLGVEDSKVSVIPLGPNRSEKLGVTLGKKISESYNLPDKYLLYVGDINWNKNVVGLVKAFSELNSPSLHLVLVGKVFADKPDIPEFKRVMSEINTSPYPQNIHLLGFVPSHHLSVLYQRAVLYVQPSWYEGFGLPILEAMKHGCPVLTSDRGSLPEVGGDSVAYFNPGKNMSDKILELLRSPQKRQELSLAGPVRAKEFTWSKTAELTYKVYEKVLAERT